MKRRRPGLQQKWMHVVNSLQQIVPSYDRASSKISLFQDRRMRREAVKSAVTKGDRVLDLGAGPGNMSKLVIDSGGDPVLIDASRVMLKASGLPDLVQGVFEYLPFRADSFESVVSGFALRDASDLSQALQQICRVLRPGGRFAMADLGKPDNQLWALGIALYLRTVPTVVGLLSNGRSGLGYGSLYDTYNLVLHNSELVGLLTRQLGATSIHETLLGGSIVVTSSKGG